MGLQRGFGASGLFRGGSRNLSTTCVVGAAEQDDGRYDDEDDRNDRCLADRTDYLQGWLADWLAD